MAPSISHANGTKETSADSNETSFPPQPFNVENHTIEYVRPLKVIVIGTGLSGILAGILLPPKVPSIDLKILEKNEEVVSSYVH